MKILYLSSLTPSLSDILHGKREVTGLPAYYYPLKYLIDRGHEVRFVIFSYGEQSYNVQVDWFQPEWIISNTKIEDSSKGGISRYLRAAKRVVGTGSGLFKALRKERYDIIYDHSHIPLAGQIVGAMFHTPVAFRSYGDLGHAHYAIERDGALLAIFKKPLVYLSHKLPHVFFLATDDGSRADVTYKAWGRDRAKFHHWKTGIEMKLIDECETTIEIPQHPYIFFAGHFNITKRQDRVVEILHKLHNDGVMIELYFAGHMSGKYGNAEYCREVAEMVKRDNLTEYVHFLGPIKPDDLRALSYHSVATVIMHDLANIGNVFYETLSTGATIITTDDGSTRQFIESGENGFIVESTDEAVEIIKRLLTDEELRLKIREGAIATSRQMFTSAEERFTREVKLLEDAAKNGY